jgi:hypothetical protein
LTRGVDGGGDWGNWLTGEKKDVGALGVFFSCKNPDNAFCCASKSSVGDKGALSALVFCRTHIAEFGGLVVVFGRLVVGVVSELAVVFGELGAVFGGLEDFSNTLGAETGGLGSDCGEPEIFWIVLGIVCGARGVFLGISTVGSCGTS